MYLDDILVPSKTEDEGSQKLRKLLETLREAHLCIRLQKCKFLSNILTYLGHEIQEGKQRPGNEKIKAV